jgi:hypothetical protein
MYKNRSSGKWYHRNPHNTNHKEDNRMEHTQDSPFQTTVPQKKHSGLGIASFILALVAIIGIIGSVITMVVSVGSAISDPAAINPENPSFAALGPAIAASFGMIISVVLSFVGAILGIVALFQKERAKLFSILGTVFNSLIVFGLIALFLIGIIATVASGQL